MIVNNLKKDVLVFKVQLLEGDISKLCKPVTSNQRGDEGGGMDCLIRGYLCRKGVKWRSKISQKVVAVPRL